MKSKTTESNYIFSNEKISYFCKKQIFISSTSRTGISTNINGTIRCNSYGFTIVYAAATKCLLPLHGA